MGFLLRWGGILLGAIALFSLAHQRYAFALAAPTRNALDHFRLSLHPLAEHLSQGLRPGIPADLIIIYFVLAILLFWFYIFDDLEWSQSGEEPITLASLLGRTVIALIWPLLIPAALYLMIVRSGESSVRAWGFEITKVLASFVILFAANSSLSTLLWT
jgi:hypothetical protein